MKYFITSVIIILIVQIPCLGQSHHGRVFDSNTNALSGVTITNLKTLQKTKSESPSGNFSIEANDMDTVRFEKKEYTTLDITGYELTFFKNLITLTDKKNIELSPINFVPLTSKQWYQVAVENLKKRLIRNKRMSYKSFHSQEIRKENESEQEDNIKKRSLEAFFTSNLTKTNPKKTHINYKYYLDNLSLIEDNLTDSLIIDKNVYSILFDEEYPRKLDDKPRMSEMNNILILTLRDGIQAHTYYINRDDSTLFAHRYIQTKPAPYGVAFDLALYKSLSGYKFAVYEKTDEGYYLTRLEQNGKYYLKHKFKYRSQVIFGNSVTEYLPAVNSDSKLKISINTDKLYIKLRALKEAEEKKAKK